MAISIKTAYQYKEDAKFCNDGILNRINNKFITLVKDDKKLNNSHLEKVIKEGVIPLMKNQSPFFEKVYNSLLHGGSYYKGTKVGKPDEYDLNMIINLPWKQSNLKFETPEKRPGYIKIKVAEDCKLPDWEKYKELSKILSSNNYLDQNKFREVIESILQKSLMTLPEDKQFRKNGRILKVNNVTYSISYKKSGPAFTFTIKNGNSQEIDIDLVPSIEFSVPPPKRYKGFKTGPKVWSIIPKPINEENGNLMWRVNFYREEKERLKGPMKTIIRLLKKLRDTQNMKNLCSYFIESLALGELRNYDNDPNFMRLPLTCIFMHMMEKLLDATKKHYIPYFYNKDFNLLGKISEIEMKNYAGRFAQIVSKIQRNIDTDMYIIASFILTKEELIEIQGNSKSSVSSKLPEITVTKGEIIEIKENSKSSVSSQVPEITEKLEGGRCILC